MTSLIQDILIVGGGTAGWMSAVYLNQTFGERIRITVVESDTVPTVGVGEATFNTIKGFFDYAGLSEREWMPACSATYKLAIKFVDWTADGRPFYHPFQRAPDVRGIALPEWWLKLREGHSSFDDSCFNVPALCDAGKAPFHRDGRLFDGDATYPLYGYHFDAALLAEYLRSVAVRRGVNRLAGDVVDVPLTDEGDIASVTLRDGRSLRADLYLDATGFRGLLINGALEEPFQSFAGSLLCDRAVAMRIPSTTSDEIRPYTTATARGAGWIWDIPLANRVGTGYVYSSAFVEPEQAERELRAHLGPAADEHAAAHLRMRVGRCRRSWVGNCVAVGLSSGFVEPLESTGIFFIQHALVELVNHFPERRPDPAVVDSYNAAVAQCIDGVRDFLVLHYAKAGRVDTDFWRTARSDLQVSDELAGRLAIWRTRLPNPSTVDPHYHGFAPYSYWVMLLGLGNAPAAPSPLVGYFPDDDAERMFDRIRRRSEELLASLPSHRAYIDELYGTSRRELESV